MKAYGARWRRSVTAVSRREAAAAPRRLTSMTEFALPYTWIITKSQPHADSLVIQLRRQGFRRARDLLHRTPMARLARTAAHRRERRRRCCSSPAAPRRRASKCRTESGGGDRADHLDDTRSARHPRRALRTRRRARARAGGARFCGDSGGRRSFLSHQRRRIAPARTSGRGRHSFAAPARAHARRCTRPWRPANLAQELAALRAPDAGAPPLGFCFWSPSAIENFAAARGLRARRRALRCWSAGRPMRCWRDSAPPQMATRLQPRCAKLRSSGR